jgi:mannosyl-oligosaccharide alpha-1,2-mannosidase
MASAINRRRGTTSQRSNKAGILVGLVVALIASALLLGILLGTHLLLNDPLKTAAITEKEKRPLVRGVLRPADNVVLRGAAVADNAGVVQQESPDDVGGGEKKEDDVNVNVNDDDKGELPDEHVNDPGNNADWNDPDNADETDDQEAEERRANERANQNDVTDDFPRDERASKDDKGAIPPDTYPYSLDLVGTYDFTTWKAPGGGRFKEYATGGSPYILTDEVLRQSDQLARSRREYVKKAMQFAYGAYEQYAFGHDEVLPKSKSFSDTWGGMGTTLVDSLDTLWLMGLKDEFWRARDWVRDHLEHDHVGSVSVFETTIRSLGGLLSAYDWSGDEAFLKKAEDLGSRLFKAFSSESGIPFGQVNLATGRTNNIGWAGGNAMTAEAGTLQVEFRYLAKMVGKEEFATTSERVYKVFQDMNPPNGLYPYFIRNQQKVPTFANNKLTFGAMSDSYYEYMLKIWLQGGQTESMYRDMYDKAIEGMHKELLQKSTPSGLTYIADKNSGVLDHKMDHLVCFMGGLLALGAYTDPEGVNSERAQRDLKTGKVS